MGMPSFPASEMKSGALAASRRAAVPQAMRVSHWKPRITSAIRASVSRPAWKASGAISPVLAIPLASFTMVFSRVSTRWLPTGSASTITRWMELEPTSMAAIFMVRFPGNILARSRSD